jgi:Phospholipid-translocating ATPase N-terminal
MATSAHPPSISQLLSDTGIWSLLKKETSLYSSKSAALFLFFNMGHFVFVGNETPQFIFTKGRRKTIVKGNRTFFVNNKVPDGYGDYLPAKFTKNEIISSKYTVWNFLPVNLFEQFRRVANFYFLSIAIITVIKRKHK